MSQTFAVITTLNTKKYKSHHHACITKWTQAYCLVANLMPQVLEVKPVTIFDTMFL